MDYLYENLGDERFQEFCSALISKEFPNFQSFPVGQPDGGRDSLIYSTENIVKEFIVFQVKFVRNANEERDLHKWLIETIKSEAEKIAKLIPKGATHYYLLTNVRGTAHLDTGSKDKVNKILEKHIPIPAICWWRDDITVLFEKDPLFKWSYLEILNGRDVLNSVLFNQINENKEKRESAIKAYLVDQYQKDNEVKFRQIDLDNKLLDLFTDVPIRVKKFNERNRSLRKIILNVFNDQFFYSKEHAFLYDDNSIGAAQFLLHPLVQNGIQKVLLEGGPGQGKSTISQYITQVHRVKLLDIKEEINTLPDHIIKSPTRLPFKIDLRHVASWLEKVNPYEETLNEEYFKQNWSKNLESFLVGHIFNHSKLEDFSSSDLVSVLKQSPILLVFDGFDEIANVQMRSEVIEFINKGILRIAYHSKSIQVVVTSRPAAFLDAEGFATDQFPHFELTDITNNTINQYLDKWIKASGLEPTNGKALKKLVHEKLELPHLRDLAKSPMQLAILINLLRTKGKSLPDKRTDLYDRYIDLFFDRESEKSDIILDKRSLVIDIHQYLAWVMHSEAELFKNSGSMHIDDLKNKVKEYLVSIGHETTLADDLFNVMKERVCALVSRVQGTFEFEVQPLREYFCAKYLYETAPYSNAGTIKSGTKPERFSSILRNFYWHNVVRFFAGCVDRGELDMVIQELRYLKNDETFKYTDYPRIITSQLLSDYVFTQVPVKLKDVVNLITDGINIGNIINQRDSSSSNELINLPIDCGRIEIINACFDQLKGFPNIDYAQELIGIIKNNPINNLEKWTEYLNEITQDKVDKWVFYGYKLQLFYKINPELLKKIVLMGEESSRSNRLQLLIDGNRDEVIESDNDLKNLAYQYILTGDIRIMDLRSENTSLTYLSALTNPIILSSILTDGYDKYPLIRLMGRYLSDHPRHNRVEEIADFKIKDSIDEKICQFKKNTEYLLTINVSDFKRSIQHWDLLVESGRKAFNDQSCFLMVALISAGIKSKTETYDEFADLHDNNISLCKRIRCARMRSGNLSYWQELFESSNQPMLTLIVFLSWASSKTICHFKKMINGLVENISESEFELLLSSIYNLHQINSFDKKQKNEIVNEINNSTCTNRLIYLVSLRLNSQFAQEYVNNNVNGYDVEKPILESKFKFMVSSYLATPNDVNLLNEIKKAFKRIDRYEEQRFRIINLERVVDIPYDVAKIIMLDCSSYPHIISTIAEKSCRIFANSNLIPVGKIAIDENWFVDV